MAQHDYGNPQSPFSGTQLNATLRNWRDALHTLHRGTSRPSYAQGGTLWVREVSSTNWELTFYDGADDILVATINPSANTVTPAGAATPADLNTRVPLSGNVTVTGWLGVANATAGTHAVNRDTGDARYARLATANTFTAPNTFNDFITLHADPTAAMHAVPKQYVDRGTAGPVTASGSAVDFTGIPSWANHVIVHMFNVVTSAASPRIQLGGTAIETTGYTSIGSTVWTTVGTVSITNAFTLLGGNFSSTYSFRAMIGRIGSTNTWLLDSLGHYVGDGTCLAAGWKTLADPLQTIRVVVSSGSFTGGTIFVEWRR